MKEDIELADGRQVVYRVYISALRHFCLPEMPNYTKDDKSGGQNLDLMRFVTWVTNRASVLSHAAIVGNGGGGGGGGGGGQEKM